MQIQPSHATYPKLANESLFDVPLQIDFRNELLAKEKFYKKDKKINEQNLVFINKKNPLNSPTQWHYPRQSTSEWYCW